MLRKKVKEDKWAQFKEAVQKKLTNTNNEDNSEIHNEQVESNNTTDMRVVSPKANYDRVVKQMRVVNGLEITKIVQDETEVEAEYDTEEDVEQTTEVEQQRFKPQAILDEMRLTHSAPIYDANKKTNVKYEKAGTFLTFIVGVVAGSALVILYAYLSYGILL